MAGVWFAIRFCDRAANPAGVAKGDDAVGDIMVDEAACADHDVATDRDTRQDDAIAAKPNITANVNRKRGLEVLISQRGVQRVQRGVKRAVRADEHIVPKHDFSGIDENTVVVQKEILANFDIVPEPAEQVWFNIKVFTGFSEEHSDDGFSFGEVGRPCVIIVVAQIRAGKVRLFASGKERAVRHAAQTFLLFCQNNISSHPFDELNRIQSL